MRPTLALDSSMPVTLSIDTSRRLTITRAHDVVTEAELIEARRQFVEHPHFDPNFDRVWDFRDVTEAQISDEIIARLVAGSPVSGKPICRAVVVSVRPEPMKAILSFISQTRQANRRIAAFPDRASAEQWIFTARVDLPPE